MSFWNVTTNAIVSLTFLDGTPVSLAGRVVGFRRQGGIAFGHLVDTKGRIQFCFQKKTFERPEQFREWTDQIHLGDIVGITGEMWTSSTGERTVLINKNFRLLQTALLGFPDKVNGLVDPELRLRKRYLDCAINPEVKDIFRYRSQVIGAIRNYLTGQDFMELETPTLTAQASGAQAKPFITHHNALEADLYLRIAPETYLKRAVAAGFDKVFEIGKNFRNEGIDPSHLQEFTSIEWYWAYAHAEDNMKMFVDLLDNLPTFDLPKSPYHAHAWQMDPQYIVIKTYTDLFYETTGTNWRDVPSNQVDLIFKTQVRPKLTYPLFVKDYPAHLAPMAARKEGQPDLVDMWQFIVDGWEVVKCYTELTDPVLQRQLLEEQAASRAAGDEEAMMLEEDFLECMEHGMPPMSGLGMGIDRLVCLITGQKTLRDVVLFPTLLKKS